MVAPEVLDGHSPLPFQVEYDSVRNAFVSIQQAAEEGVYGVFESSVIQRICTPNPLFEPRGRFFERTGDLVSRRTMPSETEIFDLGIDLGAAIEEESHNPRGLILGYLSSCLWMDAAKAGFVGTRHTTKLTHAVQTYTRRQILDSLPLDSRTLNVFNNISKVLTTANEIDQVNDDVFSWLSTKLEPLSGDFRNFMFAHDKFSNFYKGQGENLTPRQLQEIDESVSLLNQRSMESRKYGTKPAYTEASIGGSWIFYDGEDYRQNILRRTQNTVIPPIAAAVLHSPFENLSDIGFNMRTISMGTYADINVLTGDLGEAKPDFLLIIGLDGRISIDFEGLHPIDKLLKDKPIVARMLIAEVSSIFYDLSMPVDSRSKQHQPNFATMSQTERQDFNPVLQLLIPRIRAVYDPEAIREETGRMVREHDVTWFVRLLPPGWHTSPEAIENAKKVGIQLKDNETFVREHKRGSSNAVLGHHAVRREIKLKRGKDY